MRQNKASNRLGIACVLATLRYPSRPLSDGEILPLGVLRLGITAEQFSLLVGIGGSHKPTLADLAARAGVDATTLSRSVKSLVQRDLVRNDGGRGRAGKRLVLTEGGRRLMDEAMVAWEHARAQLAEALGEEASRVAGVVMSQLAVAAQAAASAVSPTDSSST